MVSLLWSLKLNELNPFTRTQLRVSDFPRGLIEVHRGVDGVLHGLHCFLDLRTPHF